MEQSELLGLERNLTEGVDQLVDRQGNSQCEVLMGQWEQRSVLRMISRHRGAMFAIKRNWKTSAPGMTLREYVAGDRRVNMWKGNKAIYWKSGMVLEAEVV